MAFASLDIPLKFEFQILLISIKKSFITVMECSTVDTPKV